MPAQPSHNTDVLPDLRLSASLVATEARMLPLEMPELVAEGSPHRAPDSRLIPYERESSWAEHQMRRVGARCGRPLEYGGVLGPLLNGSYEPVDVEPAVPPAIPWAGRVSVAELGMRFVRATSGWPQYDVCNPAGEAGLSRPGIHPGALRDALVTAVALLLLSGEVTLLPGDYLARTYPGVRYIHPPAARRYLQAALDTAFPRVGFAVTHPAPADPDAASAQPEYGRLTVCWRRGPSARAVGSFVRAYLGLEGTWSDLWGTVWNGRHGLNGWWGEWGSLRYQFLLPDGSTRSWCSGDPPHPRLRFDEMPQGAEPVRFVITAVRLWRRWP